METSDEQRGSALVHVEVRPMVAADCYRLAAFTLGLSMATPPVRFVVPGLEVPNNPCPAPAPLLAIAAGRVVAAARFARPRREPGVEAAFAVAPDVDRYGMAVELIELILRVALESGVLRPAADCAGAAPRLAS